MRRLADYRIYFQDEQGHFTRAVELDCADDAEAIAATEKVADGKAVELWQLARKVFAKGVVRQRSPSSIVGSSGPSTP